MGRRERRLGPRLRQAMAPLGDRGWPRNRSTFPYRRAVEGQSRLATAGRQRLERRRVGQNGVAALPRLVSILRGRQSTLVPVVPAQRRRIARRALQHRILRIAYPHGGAAVQLARRGLGVDRGRLPSVSESPGASGPAAVTYPACPAAVAHEARAAQLNRLSI